MTHMTIKEETIDLRALNYFFAVEAVDPSIGTIKVTRTEWDRENGKKKNKIQMEDCK